MNECPYRGDETASIDCLEYCDACDVVVDFAEEREDD